MMDINRYGISELLHLTKKRCGKYILVEVIYDNSDDIDDDSDDIDDSDDSDENDKHDGYDYDNDDDILYDDYHNFFFV